MEKTTLLHMAVFAGHEHIVKELVEKMSDDDLDRTNKFGYTALAETTFLGNLQMAKCMLEKKKNLVSKKSDLVLLPVVLTKFFFFSSMHFAICRFPTLSKGCVTKFIGSFQIIIGHFLHQPLHYMLMSSKNSNVK
jgi:ankyrin repeat protein